MFLPALMVLGIHHTLALSPFASTFETNNECKWNKNKYCLPFSLRKTTKTRKKCYLVSYCTWTAPLALNGETLNGNERRKRKTESHKFIPLEHLIRVRCAINLPRHVSCHFFFGSWEARVRMQFIFFKRKNELSDWRWWFQHFQLLTDARMKWMKCNFSTHSGQKLVANDTTQCWKLEESNACEETSSGRAERR